MLESISRSIRSVTSSDILVYTAIIGRADQLITPKAGLNAQFVCITDQPIKECQPWTTIRINPQKSSKAFSREIKITLPNLLPATHTVWVDGGMQITQWPLDVVTDHDIAAHRHFHRTCAYQEIRELVTMNIIDSKTGIDCATKLIQNQYTPNNGLHDASFLYRRSNDKIRAFNADWFEHIKSSNYRDQVWLDYLIGKHQLKCYDLLGKTRDSLSGHRHYGFATHFPGYIAVPDKRWL